MKSKGNYLYDAFWDVMRIFYNKVFFQHWRVFVGNEVISRGDFGGCACVACDGGTSLNKPPSVLLQSYKLFYCGAAVCCQDEGQEAELLSTGCLKNGIQWKNGHNYLYTQCLSCSKYPEFSETPPLFAFWISFTVRTIGVGQKQVGFQCLISCGHSWLKLTKDNSPVISGCGLELDGIRHKDQGAPLSRR